MSKVSLTPAQEAWIADLRSGNYSQGKAKLRTDEGFCCLGVLQDKVPGNTWSPPLSGRCYYTIQGGHHALPTSEVTDTVDLYDTAGQIVNRELIPQELWDRFEAVFVSSNGWNFKTTIRTHGFSLTTLNDNGADFNLIADFLETGAFFKANAK